jgi:hypothetical protein
LRFTTGSLQKRLDDHVNGWPEPNNASVFCGQRSQQFLQPGACGEGFDARSHLNPSAIGVLPGLRAGFFILRSFRAGS